MSTFSYLLVIYLKPFTWASNVPDVFRPVKFGRIFKSCKQGLFPLIMLIASVSARSSLFLSSFSFSLIFFYKSLIFFKFSVIYHKKNTLRTSWLLKVSSLMYTGALLKVGNTILPWLIPELGTWKLNLNELVFPSSCLETFFITDMWNTIGRPLIGKMTANYFISTYIWLDI